MFSYSYYGIYYGKNVIRFVENNHVFVSISVFLKNVSLE
jgi:hypothetical protein